MKSYLSRFTLALLALLLMGFVLTACGGGEEEPITEAETADSIDSAESVAEAVEEPTETPIPATNTPEPSPTPEPTNTPEPTPDPAAGFVAFESPEGGFNLRYPEAWFSNELFGLAIFASAEELLDSPDPGEEGGVMVVITGPLEDFDDDFGTRDPVEVLNIAPEDLGIGEDTQFVEGPTATTLNGQDAAVGVITATSDSGIPLTAYLAVVVNEDVGQAAVLLGATPAETAEEYLPTFEAIANTLEITEPVAVEEPVDPDPGTGDLPPTEGFLLFGDDFTATVPAGGVSTWDFIGLEGEEIEIVVEPQTSDLDVVVDVVDANGSSILEGGAVDQSFGAESITVTMPSSGTFYILVTGFSAEDTGDYRITFNEVGGSTGSNGSTGTTTVVGDLGYGETLTGAVSAADPAPSFTFGGNTNDIVRVVVDPADEFDVMVDIVDASGESLLVGGRDNSFGTEVVATVLSESGEYAVVVMPFTEGETGSFDLSLYGPSGSVVFAGDTLEEEGEDHAFPFNSLAGDIVFAAVEPQEELDVVVQVFNEDTDEEIMSMDRSFGAEGVGFIVPDDDNYYFLVSGFVADDESSEGGSNLGSYDIAIIGSEETIFELAYGDTVRGQTSADRGFVEYTFGGTAGDTIIITVNSDENIDTTIEVTDLDDNELAAVDDAFSGEEEVLTYTFEADGLVIIRVSDFFGGQGVFELLVDAG